MKNPFKQSKEKTVPTGEMSLLGHLTELRKRLLRSVIAIVIGSTLVWAFRKRIFGFLEAPYCDFQERQGVDCRFLILEPLGEFSVMLSLAGYGGIVLAMPVILYQLGRFVLPGLYPHEKRTLLPFVGVSVILLFAGMAAAYFMMPQTLDVLLGLGVDSFRAQFTPRGYIGFFVKMLFAFGIAAELPLILVFLQKVGIVKTEMLRNNRRIALVAVAILGAIITPTGDPFTLAVVTLPMYLFYEISMVIGARMQPVQS